MSSPISARRGGAPIRQILGRYAAQVILAPAVAGALYLLGRWAFSLEIAYALYLAVVLAALAGRALSQAVRPPASTTKLIREDSEARVFSQLPDRPFAGARKWEERLELVRGDNAYFRRAILPELAGLVDERLRVAGDPQRAREILGQQVWDFLAAEPGQAGQGGAARTKRAPSPAELSAIVSKLEELWAQPR